MAGTVAPAVMRNFLLAIDASDLVQSADAGGESAMHTKYFVVNECCKCKVIKYFRAVTPNIDGAELS
jgi:hypothetical protein